MEKKDLHKRSLSGRGIRALSLAVLSACFLFSVTGLKAQAVKYATEDRPCVKKPVSVPKLPATPLEMAIQAESQKSHMNVAQRTAAAAVNAKPLPFYNKSSNNILKPGDVNNTAPTTNGFVLTGTLSVADPTYNRTLTHAQGAACGLSAVGTMVHYKVHTFTLTATSNVVISLLTSDGGSITPATADTYLELYNTAGFVPSSACTNSIMSNDDAASGGLISRIATTTALPAGTYTTVVTSFDNTPADFPWTYGLSIVVTPTGGGGGGGGCTTGNIIADGGFENSVDDGSTVTNPSWNSTSTNFTTSLCDVALCGTGGGAAPPRNGNFWAWFGGIAAAETGVVQQSVTIPSGATANLNFYLRIGTVNAPFNATLQVMVDGVSKLTYTEPSTAEAAYTLRTLNLSTYADGAPHVIRFQYDNPAGSGTSNFTVDDVSLDIVCPTNPSVTINQAATQADPTSASPIVFTAVFSEAVTGFDASDITLSGTALPTTAVVTGTGPTYTVSVSGMSTSGTVIASIPAGAAVNAASLPSLASTSTDNTVTYNTGSGCVIVCPANITVNNTAGQCGAIVTYPAPTSTGTCGTITSTPSSGSFFPIGTTTVNVTSTAGTTCSFTVRVNDTQAPVVTCPANVVVNNTTGVCGAVVNFPPSYATDNCGPTSLALTQSSSTTITTGSPSCNSGGLHTDNSYYRVYDLAPLALGGTFTVRNVAFGIERANATSGTQPVTVKLYTLTGAFTLANLTLVGSQTYNIPNQTLTMYTAALLTPVTVPANAKLVVEIFTPNGQTAGNSFFIGSNTAAQTAPSYIAAATCGITQPTDMTAIGFGTRHIVINPSGTVNTGSPLTVTSTPASGSLFPVGTTTVTSTTTDASGNTGSCTFTVTVNDTQAPVITCPANIVRSTDPGLCSAVVTFTPTATDNCPGVTITSTPASGSVFPKGVTTVTSKATDASGNFTTCTFTVTVNDTQAPVLTCPANITVNNTAGQCGAVVNYPTPTVTDNCPLTTTSAPITLTQSSSTTITALNSVSCNAGGIHDDNSYYRVYDLSTMSLSGPLTVNTVTFGIEQATSGSGTQPVTVKLYTLSGTFTLANLTLVGSQTVNVPDQSGTLFTATLTSPPTVPANAKLVVELFTPNGTTGSNSFFIGSNAAAETGPSYLLAADCSITTPTTTTAIGFPNMHIILNVGGTTPSGTPPPIVSTPPSGSLFPVGTTTVTSTTVDASGNPATCSFTVTVKDAEAPVITCPADIVRTATVGQCSAAVSFTVTATDNCSATVVSTPASGSVFPIGTTVVTSKATDPAGNVSTCTFKVTVIDPQLPVITTQPAPTAVCEGQTGTISVVATNAVSYQWQVFSNGAWVNVSGATGATLTLSNVTLAMNLNQYRVQVIGLCTTVTSDFVALTIKRNPVVALTGASVINLNPSTPAVIYSTVSPVGTYTYQWTRDGIVVPAITGSSFPLSVDLFGTYQVKATDVATGCFGISNSVTVKDSASGRLFVYPNPNNGFFQVRYYNAGGATTVRTLNVYDSKGARIFTRQYATSTIYERMDVNISNYAGGIYMIEVRDAGGKKLASAKVRKQ